MKERTLWLVYSLAAIVVSVQKLTQGQREGGYTFYENYVIFKNSFNHLVQSLNPYAAFPAEQWDLFKYSPAFALFMAPFAALPDWVGLTLWNGLNALVLLAAILNLPVLSSPQRIFMAWFVLIELVTSLQNSQSNGLTAGLMLWSFIALERSRPGQAAGHVAAAAFIKIFGLFAGFLALLYPGRLRFAGWLAAWIVFLTTVPLAALSAEQLARVYGWWWDLLRDDHAASVGLSVQGWLQTWFGWTPSKTGVTLAGLALFILSTLAPYFPAILRRTPYIVTRVPFTVHREPSTVHRTLACASLLIWSVIFNHKAESPTFIIALCGVALWWSTAEKKLGEKVLLGLAFLFVSLSPTDIFPKPLRQQLVQPYVLKAVPCIVIWGLITWRMFAGLRRPVYETLEVS